MAVHQCDYKVSRDADLQCIAGCELFLLVLVILQGKHNGRQKLEPNQKLNRIKEEDRTYKP